MTFLENPFLKFFQKCHGHIHIFLYFFVFKIHALHIAFVCLHLNPSKVLQAAQHRIGLRPAAALCESCLSITENSLQIHHPAALPPYMK